VDFSNPSILPFLGLAALPILVHFLFRRRTRRIAFPTLRLLRTVDPHPARRRRLHELALLALRTAAILLAVLAAARPSTGGSLGSSSADTVVLLDDSASMALGGESSAWTAAVAAARGVFERMGTGDRGALHRVVAGPAAPAEGLTQDGRALVRALEESSRTDGHGSLAAAIRRAGEALSKGTSPDRRLLVVTDLDTGAFAEEDLATAVRTLPQGTRLVVVPTLVGAAAHDVAVRRLALGEGTCVVGRPLHLTVGVERRAGQAPRARVELAAGRDAPRAVDVAFSPAGTAEATFDLAPAAPGLLSLVASVPGDDFGPDDRRHLVVAVRPRLDVVLIDGDLEDRTAVPALGGGALLALALDPPGDGSLAGMRVTRVRPSDADLTGIRAADVLLVHDAPDLPDAVAAAVLARHREGAGLLVVAAERAGRSGRAVPDALADAVPGRVSASLPGATLDAKLLTVAAPEDAALAGLATQGSAKLEGVFAKYVLEIALRADTTVLLEAGGRPVLVRGPGTPAPALLLAMSLAPSASPWALRPTFLAWLHGLVPALARGGVERPSVVVGEGGAPRPVLRAGVYDVDRPDAASASFAANADLREAEASRLDPDAAAARLGGDAVAVAASALASTLARGGQHDLTGVFLVLAALALLAETVFANLPRRRLGVAAKASLASREATAA